MNNNCVVCNKLMSINEVITAGIPFNKPVCIKHIEEIMKYLLNKKKEEEVEKKK